MTPPHWPFFSVCSQHLHHILAAFLLTICPSGKFHVISAIDTNSVATTNVVSERTFAQLDRLKREKPNSSVLAIEGMVLFATNKTAAWLHSVQAKPASTESIFWTALCMALKNTDSYTGNGVDKLVKSSNSKFNKKNRNGWQKKLRPSK